MTDRTVFNVTSRLQDFEPFHLTESFRRPSYGILDCIFYAFFGRSNKFENLVNMLFHVNLPPTRLMSISFCLIRNSAANPPPRPFGSVLLL
jgi:hypothetical protein